MIADMQIPVIVGGDRGHWLSEVITLAENDTDVTFLIESNTGYGYKLFIDMSTAATPTTAPPIQSGQMDFSVAGECTINFSSPITASQAGAKVKLRVFM